MNTRSAMSPGALVKVRSVNDTAITLWKSMGGEGITGRLRAQECGIIVARYIDPSKDTDTFGDQILVLTSRMELGWNETRLFAPWPVGFRPK